MQESTRSPPDRAACAPPRWRWSCSIRPPDSLRYASFGHPQPLIVSPEGRTRFLDVTSAGPLGTGSATALATDVLAPGEVVLLYSDGLIERPGGAMPDGMAELARVAGDAAANRVLPLGAAPTPAERVCQLTVDLLTRTGYRDDVTTLAAQRLDEPVTALVLELPAEPANLRLTRRAIDEWLGQIGATTEDRNDLTTAVGEIVTNSIEHAYPAGQPGPVHLEAMVELDGWLRCTVSDHGSWRLPQTGRNERGRGLLIAERLADHVQVDRPAETLGARGTTVTLRHRLHQLAMVGSQVTTESVVESSQDNFVATVEADGDRHLIRARGAIDITSVDEFARTLQGASRGGVVGLTVDLAEVTQLSSVGVRALFAAVEQLGAHRQDLILIAPAHSPAHAVLDIVNLPHRPLPTN